MSAPFRMVDLIGKKRDGKPLTEAEIQFVVQGYTRGDIPDYQMSAFAMAVYFKGMSAEELSAFTAAMIATGEVVDLGAIRGVKVDKHSTGGVGDKTSLVVGPLAASVGVPVAKMSGRGLGHTGGTIDKLQSIPGFRVHLTNEQFVSQVNRIKMAIVSQTENRVPSDRKLYALRDVTATVSSIPLISSSIMSKKIAAGADAIVLDVKVGSGAFMKTMPDARELAAAMVEIGKRAGKRTIALLTDMNEPLGHEIGNANEVMEAIRVLRGEGEARFAELCLTVAAHMCVAGGKCREADEAYALMERQIGNGEALRKFEQFVAAQGGDPAVISDFSLLPQANRHFEVKSEEEGYVTGMDAEMLGFAAMRLGAGRSTHEDAIDHSAGITLRKKSGQFVRKGETLAILHTNLADIGPIAEDVRQAFIIREEPVKPNPIVYDVIS